MATLKCTGYVFFDPYEFDDEPFLLRNAPESIGLSYNSLNRYAKSGKQAVDGVVVKLKVCLLPAGVATTMRAWREFISALNGKRE